MATESYGYHSPGIGDPSTNPARNVIKELEDTQPVPIDFPSTIGYPSDLQSENQSSCSYAEYSFCLADSLHTTPHVLSASRC